MAEDRRPTEPKTPEDKHGSPLEGNPQNPRAVAPAGSDEGEAHEPLAPRIYEDNPDAHSTGEERIP